MFGTPPNVRRALQPNNEVLPAQLPVNGMNTRDAFARMAPDDAISLINVLSNPYGLTTRGGFEEYATNLPPFDVATLMSYYPATAGSSFDQNRMPQSALTQFLVQPRASDVTLGGSLYACVGGGVYDITAGGPGPWVPDPNVSVTSDYWSWINFQNAAGNYLLACNHDGGYYTNGGASFDSGFSPGFLVQGVGFSKVIEGLTPGTIQGVNPDLFTFILSWKRRLWFIEKNSTRAWYLPVEALTGLAQVVDFGVHFRHGGRLELIGSWTVDGGEGIDDYLVGVSSEGDVVIFKGTDPNDSATFGLHGIWYIGALPEGHRGLDTIGGDLHLLSVTGISNLSQLIAMGQIAQEMTENTGSKIDPFIRNLMQLSQNDTGWYLTFLPHEQMLVVGVPPVYAGEGSIMLAYKIRQKAWSVLNGLPVATLTNHGGLIFGGGRNNVTGVTAPGKVLLMFDNALDYVTLDDPKSGNLINCRITPAYSSFGSPAMFKRYTMIRPTFTSQGPVSARLIVLTDYTQGSYASVPTLPAVLGDLWDDPASLWDTAKWMGFSKPIHKWLGVNGSGFAATVQMDFVAAGGTKIGAIDWNVVPGGIL